MENLLIDLKEFLAEFESTLALPETKPKKVIILGVAGPSRVGKTTVLNYIGKKLPYFVRLNNDDMRLFLFSKGYEAGDKVEKFIHEKTPVLVLGRKFLQSGYSVILDFNMATNWERKGEIDKIAKEFNTEFFIIRVHGRDEYVKERLKNKKYSKDGLFKNWEECWEHYLRSKNQFNYDGQNYLVEVDTEKSFDEQLNLPIDILRKVMLV